MSEMQTHGKSPRAQNLTVSLRKFTLTTDGPEIGLACIDNFIDRMKY